ncbi:MAG: hypothetical protein ACI8QZ_000769 [Chlamydiales bacterium]|jgi:uncharacterized protein (TIGR01777 family)
MKILMSGASGLVGSALCKDLRSDGHSITRIVRRAPAGDDEVEYNPAQRKIDRAGMEGHDAVVHLAGENIAGGRWNKKRMLAIRDSRVDGTRAVCRAVARLKHKPEVVITASAVGWYGDRGDELLDEDSKPGTGFLVEVCRDWEAGCYASREAGLRVVNVRMGVVLAAQGGALAKMLTPFKLGLGGRLGSGQQHMSWIGLTDLVRALRFCIDTPEIVGPVNAVSPDAATNQDFTKTLGRVLSRPTAFPMPAFVARLLFGQMADQVLLASAKVAPKKLQEAGFKFEQTVLEDVLRDLLASAS